LTALLDAGVVHEKRWWPGERKRQQHVTDIGRGSNGTMDHAQALLFMEIIKIYFDLKT
jgi:hypothetical protein